MDSQITLKLLQGDASAFEALFKDLAQPLIYFSWRYTHQIHAAENIVQDVFLRIWQDRHKLDPARNLKAYLYMLTRNESLKYLRRKKVEDEGTAYARDSLPEVRSPEEISGAAEIAREVQRLVAGLPPKSRHIFLLAKIDRLSYAEIAAVQGVSIKTVENHMARALKILRRRLGPLFYPGAAKGK